MVRKAVQFLMTRLISIGILDVLLFLAMIIIGKAPLMIDYSGSKEMNTEKRVALTMGEKFWVIENVR